MSSPHRLAAGGIVLSAGKVLLVRYVGENGGSYLAAPGGGVEGGEELAETVARETLEETGVTVRVGWLLAVEDLLCRRCRMCKLWFLCDLIGGRVRATEGARAEGIVAAGWYGRDEIRDEVVYPSILTEYDWTEYGSPNWTVRCLQLRRAMF